MKKTLLIILSIVCVCQIAQARQPQRGYRGFVEWSSSMRYVNYDTDDNGREYGQNMLYWGFTTSHGYQINPMFYVGAGLTLAGYKVEQYDIAATPDSFTMTYIGSSHPMRAYFSIRVGIDF